MNAPTRFPPRVPLPEEALADFRKQVADTEAFSSDDIEWIESILTRPDSADGYRQLTQPFVFQRADQSENLYVVCKTFNAKRAELTPIELHEARMMLRQLVWSKRVSMYRQKKILVAAPQRKKHPKYDVPNLFSWEGAGQHVNTQLLAVYGLDYVAARTQCVKQALSDGDATHILFVDDDVMMPKDFARVLVDSGLPSVAGIYSKKSTAFQSNATTSLPDAQFVYNQHVVDMVQGDMTPVPASCVGGGMWLIDLNIFRQLPEPWFAIAGAGQMGNVTQVRIGEDSMLVQKMAAYGITTHVIPGLVGVHCDFLSGKQYGPEWLIDPVRLKLRPEFEPHYHPFPEDLDCRELVQPDIKDFFGKNVKLVQDKVFSAEQVQAFEQQHAQARGAA